MYTKECLSPPGQHCWKISGWSIPFGRDRTAPEVLGRGICHDEKVYPDPETFNPERFLGPDGKIDPSVKDPGVRIFGSGRRWGVCWDLPHAMLNLDDIIGSVPGDTLPSETCTLWLQTSSPHSTFSLLSTRMDTRNHLRQRSSTR